MKAAYYTQTGAPSVIQYGEQPTPVPKGREVLVKIGAASLNPVDTYIRSGAVAMALPNPFIPGCDLAGTVTAIGPEVKRYQVGDRVWGSNQGLLGRQGTFAEFAAVDEEWLYPTPEGIRDVEVAAIALVGITAHLGLFMCAKLQAGETVFVNGGTGGVGSMVVQMAKAVGAKVITTVGSSEKAEVARTLGADRAILYKSENVGEAVLEFTQKLGVQVWYETQRDPDFINTVPLIAPRGRMVIMAGRTAQPLFPVGPFYVKGLSLHGFAMFNISADEQRQAANDIMAWLQDKQLCPLIGREMPLSEAANAHQLQEENTLNKAGTLSGKIVLIP